MPQYYMEKRTCLVFALQSKSSDGTCVLYKYEEGTGRTITRTVISADLATDYIRY